MDPLGKRKGAVLGLILALLLPMAVACSGQLSPISGATPTPAGNGLSEAVTGTPAPGATPAPLITATPSPTLTPVPPSPALKNPGTLIVATIGDPESLDPAWQYDTASSSVVYNVYEPLLFFQREKIDEFVPMLSTGWVTSEDRLNYSFTLREGVRFHQGGTLEPHDVAYTFRRNLLQDRAGGPQWVLLEPLLGVFGIKELATQLAGMEDFADVDAASLAQTCERVKQAVTYDDAAGTVTFHLARPFGPFLQILASGWGSVLDQEWMLEQGAWDGDCTTWKQWHDPAAEESVIFSQMNGTGPSGSNAGCLARNGASCATRAIGSPRPCGREAPVGPRPWNGWWSRTSRSGGPGWLCSRPATQIRSTCPSSS